MKFFTLDWWMGNQTRPDRDAHAAYEEHRKSLVGMPPALEALMDAPHLLHDANVRKLAFDPKARTVLIDLDVDPGDGSSERLQLQYLGVASVVQRADPSRGLPGPHGFGDLGYDEVHRVREGWEHRLLFSSGIEFHVVFADFKTALNPEAHAA